MPARQPRGWVRSNSHIVTFRVETVYRAGNERLVIAAGTQLVGLLTDGPEPTLSLDTMTLSLSPSMVEIAPNPDPQLTLQVLAQQSAQAAGEALAAGDPSQATDRYLQAAAQYRLLGDVDAADEMQLVAQRAHNTFLRTAEGRANFDRHTGELSDEALRQLGATIRLAVRQLGGYQYLPVTPDEALAAWEIIRQAVAQVANLDRWHREQPRPSQPITAETIWVNAENMAGDLLSEPQGSPERRGALAELALALDPDEAGGYTLLGHLADERGDRAAARRWYEEGVRAGERKLGAAYFSDPDRPRFWLAVETRPYMRARAALAYTLSQLGQPEQAIVEYFGMLELNPGDNQGLRYILASLLLERHDHAAFARLYRMIAEPLDDEGEEEQQAAAHGRAEPPDPLDPANVSPFESAYWLYPLALYHFQREGAGELARTALKLARNQNPHVIPLLLGRQRMPLDNPDSYSPGSFEEAALYVRTGRTSWTTTPGALDWLRGKPASQPATRSARKPVGLVSVGEASLHELLSLWLDDDSTPQSAQTKRVYRASIARLLDWLATQGQPLTAAALTAEQIERFLNVVAADLRGQSRSRIRGWCDWLVRRGLLTNNPLPQ